MLSMSRHMRLSTLVALAVFTVATAGCSSWRPVPTTDPASEEWAQLSGKRVSLHIDNGVTNLWVERVEYPHIYGTDKLNGPQRWRELRFDLREVHCMEVRELNKTKTVLWGVGIAAVLVAALATGEYSSGTLSGSPTH